MVGLNRGSTMKPFLTRENAPVGKGTSFHGFIHSIIQIINKPIMHHTCETFLNLNAKTNQEQLWVVCHLAITQEPPNQTMAVNGILII